MASSGYINCTLWSVTVAGTKINCRTGASFSVSRNIRKSVNADDGGWEKALKGVGSWNLSVDSEFKADAAYGLSDLYDALETGDDVVVDFTTAVSGDDHWTGSAQIESIEMDAPAEDTGTFSASFIGNGAPSKETND